MLHEFSGFSGHWKRLIRFLCVHSTELCWYNYEKDGIYYPYICYGNLPSIVIIPATSQASYNDGHASKMKLSQHQFPMMQVTHG